MKCRVSEFFISQVDSMTYKFYIWRILPELIRFDLKAYTFLWCWCYIGLFFVMVLMVNGQAPSAHIQAKAFYSNIVVFIWKGETNL